MFESFINIFTILNLTILSGLLWLKKDKLPSNKFLAVVVFSPAVPFLLNYLIYTGFIKDYPWLMLCNIGNLWAPAIAFYVRSLLKKEFKWKMLIWHIIPQLINMIVWAVILLQEKSYRDSIFDNVFHGRLPWQFDFLNAILLVQCLGYLSYSILLIRKNGPDIDTSNSRTLIQTFSNFIKGIYISTPTHPLQEWLRQFIGLCISINILVIILGFLIPRDLLAFIYIPILYNIVYLLIVNISFKYSSLFNSSTNERMVKYSYSSLSKEQSQEYYQKITHLFNSDKLYLNCDLRIEDVAEKLAISTLFISQAINQNEGKNFFEFTNSYRIEEAKKLLKVNPELTIEAIAFDSGFGSKATFNRIFKKHTGLTPSDYAKNIYASVNLISKSDVN